MDLHGDDLAGVVDLFGGLTRAELEAALAELAFKRGGELEDATFGSRIDDALETYRLIRLEPEQVSSDVDSPILVSGPSAFPTLPEGARDLRHILELETREIKREKRGQAAAERLRKEATRALDAGDEETVTTVIDRSYDIETWASVDLSALRDHLDEHG